MNFPVDVLFKGPGSTALSSLEPGGGGRLAGKPLLREKLGEATVASLPLLSEGGLQGLGAQS